jgi:PAS domain S-box-containing protein
MADDIPREEVRFRLLVLACSLLSVAAGFIGLLGWSLGLPSLTSLWSGRIPMAPSTAMLFVLYGIVAFLRARFPMDRGAYRASLVLNIAGTLVAVPLLFLSSLGIYPAIEHLGFQVTGTVGGAPIGHMSPVTAICFLLASFSFFALHPSLTDWSRRAKAALFLGSLLAATSFVLFLAYLFGTPLFYTGSFIPPAASTSIAFVALGFALLCLALPHTRFLRRQEERVTRTEHVLVLVFLLLAGGIVTLGYLYHLNYERRYRHEVESRLSAIAELKVSELVQYRKERLEDAAVFFKNVSFSDMVRRFLERPGDTDARRQIQAWIGNYGAQYEGDRVFLLDTRGVARISVPETPEPVDSTVLHRVSEIARSGRVAFHDFHRNGHNGKIYLAVLIPILDEREGRRPLGVLVLRIDPEKYLYPLISHWPTPSRTAETLLVRRDGDQALFLNELRFRKDAALTLRFPLDPKSDSPAVKAVLGKKGIVEGRDYRGKPVLADLREVPDSPWFVVARVDLSEVYEPARERLWWMVTLVCVLLLAAGTGVGLAWRQQRARFYLERFEAERERAWLQDVISRSLDEIYVFDPDTLRFKFVNTGGLRNIGYSMEELASMTPIDIKPEYTEEPFRAMVQPLVSGEREVLVIETVHRRKDGSDYPVEVHLQLVSAAAGIVFLAIVNDITERKRAEERIRKGFKLETALRRIDAKILKGADFREALGIACDAIVDMGYHMCWVGLAEPDFSVRPIEWRGFDTDYLDRMIFRWDESPEGMGPTGIAIRTGRPYVCPDILTNGIYAPWRSEAVKRGFRSSASIPLNSGKGQALGILHVYGKSEKGIPPEDVHILEMFAQQCALALVSARRIEEFRAFHRRLTSHIERMPLGYIAHDREFRIVEFNPAAERIFGWSSAEATGKHPFELFLPREIQAHVSGIWSKLREGDNSSVDSVGPAIRKDGTTIICEWFNTSLRDATGAITGLTTLVHDITEKVHLEKQLQMAQKMESVGTLAGGIAHDFNNALTGIVGFGELLRIRMAGDEQAVHDLDEILRCAERASTLTRQLLAYARRQVIEPVNLNLSALVADLMKFIGKVVGEHIEVKTSLEKNVPTIHADGGQIEQVVMNLCLNARDAMPEGGRLVVETEDVYLEEEYVRQNPYMKTGRYALLTVSDTGVGMDEKTRERVFDPFFTTKGPDKGTGLGLAMVYGIVKQHGGFIHLYSEPGKGTAFKVYFPAIEAPPDAVPAIRREEIVRGGNETILLAEDEEAIRALAERILTGFGYTVLVARNGEEAIEMFRQNKEIVLAVLDVVMPRKGGREAFEEMHKQNPRLKVIFMSGYTSNGIHDSFVLIAGMPFLQKPFGPTILARKIREVLDSQ